MKREEIQEKVYEIINDVLAVDGKVELNDDLSLKGELGADSLDIVAIVSEIEETFDVEVKEEVIEQMTTIKDIINKLVEMQ